MTNPAEKIRQVVEETAAIMYDRLDAFENLAAAEEVTKYVARQVLDVVINIADDDRLYFLLKEARTSITNSTHE